MCVALLEAWGFAKPIRQLHAPKPPPAPERVPQSQEKKRRIESNKDDSEDEKVRNLEVRVCSNQYHRSLGLIFGFYGCTGWAGKVETEPQEETCRR